jgi:amino acid transporter
MANEQRQAQIKKDAADLQKYGYKQQLWRDMGGFSNFAVSFSTVSILSGALTMYGYGYGMAGPAMNTFGWPLVTIFNLCIAAGMAELSSAIPLSGGLYHWAIALGGRGWGWFTAYINILGQFALIAGVDFGCAMFMTPALGLPQTFKYFLTVYCIIVIIHATLNHVGLKLVAKMNDFSAIWHMFGVAVMVAALLIIGPHPDVRHALEFGFTTSNYPYWFAFMLGLLQAQYTYTGYDGSCNMTEETVNPRISGAWGVYAAVLFAGIFGYVLLFVVTLYAKNDAAVAAAVNPFLYIFNTALGSTLGNAILWIIVAAQFLCGNACFTSGSRIIYSFARDGGLPFSKFWAKVNDNFHTPTRSIWLLAVAGILIALWSSAYNVMTAFCSIGLDGTYVLPILLKLVAIAKGDWKEANNGPWHLGKISNLVNVLAVIYGFAVCLLFVLPPNQICFYTLVAYLVVLGIYWYAYMKKHFVGPAFYVNGLSKAD